MTFALTSFGSVNPGRWAYSTNTKGLRFGNGFYSPKKQNPEGFAFILRQYCDQSPQASLGGWSFTFSDALLCALFFGGIKKPPGGAAPLFLLYTERFKYRTF